MKKIFVAMLLMVAVTAVAQTASAPAQPAAPAAQPTAQQNPAPPPPAAQKKEIKDTAEYNAYVGAVQQTDAAAKVSGLEAFLTQYPNSVMKEDALELLMGAYQQTGNQAKTLETAQKVLLANPCNIRALALLAYNKQAMATGPNSSQNLTDAGQTGEKGLQCMQTATKPDGTPAAEWDKLKTTAAAIFNNAAGMSAYQAKDYAKAQQFLLEAVKGDQSNVTEVYYLALAYLAPGPTEKDVDGLFFIARASNLQTKPEGREAIAKYGKSKYVKYHGSDEGWNNLLTLTAGTPLPPANFTIAKYVPPTPAEQAAEIVKSKAVKDMSFAEWQMVLSEGTPEDAEKVWSVLKGKPLLMEAHIISIDTSSKTATRLLLAGSSDDVDAKRADIDLTMSAVLSKTQMPKEDTEFKFGGTPVSYVAKPFVMTMNDGALLAPKAPPKAPVHRKPVAH